MRTVLQNLTKKYPPTFSPSFTYSYLTKSSSYSFAANDYGQTIVNKYIVTRARNQKYSLFVDPEYTIQQFK